MVNAVVAVTIPSPREPTLSSMATTSCARHPDVETGLRCTRCDDPICPTCAVEAPIGMRCPGCATPDRGGGLRRRPEQVRGAVAAAVPAALVGGLVMALVLQVGFFSLVAAWLVGAGIGRGVREGASGNTVDVVRGIAVAAAVAAVVGGWVVVGGDPVRLLTGLRGALLLGLAAFGAVGATR